MPSGPVSSLVTLGFDIYSIRHKATFPKELRKRLLKHRFFQGARYEIAVAAIFARAGFDIRFYGKSSYKHGEFIATDPDTKQDIIVEAKSRHRKGILATPGTVDELRNLRGDIKTLLVDAFQQSSDRIPFVIFIDVNALPTPGVAPLEKPWVHDIKSLLEQYGAPTKGKPDPSVVYASGVSGTY